MGQVAFSDQYTAKKSEYEQYKYQNQLFREINYNNNNNNNINYEVKSPINY